MAGRGTKQIKRKSKINSGVFKKVFSFKQHQQGSKSLHANGTPSSADAPNKIKSSPKASNAVGYRAPLSNSLLSDDDTSTCSSTVDCEGLLVFVTAHRMTPSSPPPAILGRLPGARHGDTKHNKSDNFLSLSLGRRRNSSSSVLPPNLQIQAPYQSKKAQKNLSGTLKSCRQRSESNHALSDSAWERRHPTFSSKSGTLFSRSKRSGLIDECLPLAGTRDADIDITRTVSSSSSCLPPEISPMNRFIPIGCDEDYDYPSFDSDDYDICKESMSEDVGQSVADATIVISTSFAPVCNSKSCMQIDGNPSKDISVSPPAANKAPKKSLPIGLTGMSCAGKDATLSVTACHNTEIDKCAHPPFQSVSIDHTSTDKCAYSSVSKQAFSCVGAGKPFSQHGTPPSPVSTDCTSRESDDLTRGVPLKRSQDPRYQTDEYCVPLERDDDDWFSSMKQEIFKLSSFFTSNCGVTRSDM